MQTYTNPKTIREAAERMQALGGGYAGPEVATEMRYLLCDALLLSKRQYVSTEDAEALIDAALALELDY